jgi:hypothetical protein
MQKCPKNSHGIELENIFSENKKIFLTKIFGG